MSTVCSCGFSAPMISRYPANSETKRSAQTPTEGGMTQRTASLREKLGTVELGLCFIFSTFTYVDSLKKKYGAYNVVFISSRKNVNTGPRCSSLHTVQSHELCYWSNEKSWSHFKTKAYTISKYKDTIQYTLLL